jgi:hypothetical protein
MHLFLINLIAQIHLPSNARHFYMKNLQRQDQAVQIEPFHTEGKDMKSTQEMAPTSQHEIFSHSRRKKEEEMDGCVP